MNNTVFAVFGSIIMIEGFKLNQSAHRTLNEKAEKQEKAEKNICYGLWYFITHAQCTFMYILFTKIMTLIKCLFNGRITITNFH